MRNPLHLTDAKSKDLKSRLEWAARKLRINDRLPRVEPAVFLSDAGLHSYLDDVQKARVYGRDDAVEGLPWIWRDLLARPPQREQQRITPHFAAQVLPRLMAEIGIRASTAHLSFGDGWRLDPTPLDTGPTWEDRLAKRRGVVRESGRVRIYLTEQQATDERRQAVDRAARREYQVLQGITHRGIAQAVQIGRAPGRPGDPVPPRGVGPAAGLLPRRARGETDPRGAAGPRAAARRGRPVRAQPLALPPGARRQVRVRVGEGGRVLPVLRVIDWQSAARDFDTTMSSSLGASSLAPISWPTRRSLPGAGVRWRLPRPGRSGRVRAGRRRLPDHHRRAACHDPCRADRAAQHRGRAAPLRVDDAVVEVLDELVFHATRSDTGERLDSAEAFLRGLDATEQDVAVPEPTVPGADPLVAVVGQVLDGDWEVRRVLGTGATARALLVERLDELEDGEVAYEAGV